MDQMKCLAIVTKIHCSSGRVQELEKNEARQGQRLEEHEEKKNVARSSHEE